MKKKQVVPKEKLRSQVKRLANFIMANVPGEPSKSEGAIDTAIRIIKERALPGPDPRPGDVVRLKSGGGEMTVLGILSGGQVEVCGMGSFERGVFRALIPTVALSVVEKKKTQIALDAGFETKRG